MTLSMTWQPFDCLSPSDLYSVLSLRQRVFVVEQRCPYLDADGFDQLAAHGIGRGQSGDVIAVARILPPHATVQEPSLGRIAVAKHMRSFGYGRALVAASLAEAHRRYPNSAVHIDAQIYLEHFYSSFGFARTGEPFDEDGIPHIAMTKSATERQHVRSNC